MNHIWVRTWEFTAFYWPVIFSALIGRLACPENCANALHACSHLIIPTTLWNRNYCLHSTVKLRLRVYMTSPRSCSLKAAKQKQTRSVKRRSVWFWIWVKKPIVTVQVYFRGLTDHYGLTSCTVNPHLPLEELHLSHVGSSTDRACVAATQCCAAASSWDWLLNVQEWNLPLCKLTIKLYLLKCKSTQNSYIS